MDESLPVIVGVGQVTQRPDTERPREPLALMADAARLAEADAGAARPAPVARLHPRRQRPLVAVEGARARPRARPRRRPARAASTPHVGGNTPQWLVNETAERDPRRRAQARAHRRRRGRCTPRGAPAPAASTSAGRPAATPAPDIGDTRPGISEAEAKHGATIPTSVYPLFENALRAHYGRSIDEHQRALGELAARFSAVAATNPYAWFREAQDARQRSPRPTPDNRYIGFPYPKYMNAIMDVDQGAALLLTSAGEARRLGIAGGPLGLPAGAAATRPTTGSSPSASNYHTSPAIRAAGARALSMAGVAIDDVAHFDLYSCFPSAVQIARDMLGIAPDDPRPLTVTGGLPYFGGPGNNYVTHSIADDGREAARRPRAHRSRHRATAGTSPSTRSASTRATRRARDGAARRPSSTRRPSTREPHPPFADAPAGAATIETYTVLFDREGAPARGIVIGRLPDGARFIANTPPDAPDPRVDDEARDGRRQGARVSRPRSGRTRSYRLEDSLKTREGATR